MASGSNAARPAGYPAPATSPVANPWAVLAVLCLGVFMLLLDTTVVNVAQVKIKESIGANLTQIQWILDAYILTYAVFLLSFGRLGDVYGRKKLFILGMGIFTIGSLLCGLSAMIGEQLGISAVTILIIARVIQGFGGAIMMPQTLSLLTVTFPAEKRGAALGVWGSVTAMGAILGPIIGGLIVTNFAWEWIFLVNLPVGIFAMIAAWKIVPESKDPLASGKIDWGGLVLSGFGIFLVVYAAIEGGRLGWTDPTILISLALGIVLLVGFIAWERRATDPMMRLELFKIRNFWAGNTIALIISFGMLGIFFPMTLFLQQVIGLTPIQAGLTMTPMSLMILVAAPISGRLTDRIGAKWLLVSGTFLMTIGIVFLSSRIVLESDWGTLWLRLLPALIVTGLGMGLTFSPMTAAAMREVPPRIAGSASGILNTMRNIGQVLGIAILGSFLQSRLEVHSTERLTSVGLDAATTDQVVTLGKQSQWEQIPSLVPDQDQLVQVYEALKLAFVDSLHNTFMVGAFACLIAMMVAFMIRNPKPRVVAEGAAGLVDGAVPAVVIAD